MHNLGFYISFKNLSFYFFFLLSIIFHSINDDDEEVSPLFVRTNDAMLHSRATRAVHLELVSLKPKASFRNRQSAKMLEKLRKKRPSITNHATYGEEPSIDRANSDERRRRSGTSSSFPVSVLLTIDMGRVRLPSFVCRVAYIFLRFLFLTSSSKSLRWTFSVQLSSSSSSSPRTLENAELTIKRAIFL